MKHIQIFENYGPEYYEDKFKASDPNIIRASDPNIKGLSDEKDPILPNADQEGFLVMYNNLRGTGEKEPIAIYSTLEKAEAFVWAKTREDVHSYRTWDRFVDVLSGGVVKKPYELYKKLHELKNVKCYYEIFTNGKDMKEKMIKISDQWTVMDDHLDRVPGNYYRKSPGEF